MNWNIWPFPPHPAVRTRVTTHVMPTTRDIKFTILVKGFQWSLYKYAVSFYSVSASYIHTPSQGAMKFTKLIEGFMFNITIYELSFSFRCSAVEKIFEKWHSFGNYGPAPWAPMWGKRPKIYIFQTPKMHHTTFEMNWPCSFQGEVKNVQ